MVPVVADEKRYVEARWASLELKKRDKKWKRGFFIHANISEGTLENTRVYQIIVLKGFFSFLSARAISRF